MVCGKELTMGICAQVMLLKEMGYSLRNIESLVSDQSIFVLHHVIFSISQQYSSGYSLFPSATSLGHTFPWLAPSREPFLTGGLTIKMSYCLG